MPTREEQIEIVRNGWFAVEEWRRKHPHSNLELQYGNFSEYDLSGVDLHGALLEGADLSGANLAGANLSHCSLSGAQFIQADLSGTVIVDASLTDANLTDANLSGARFDETTFWRTNFTSARLDGTSFLHSESGETLWCNLDLSNCLHLNRLSHFAPSSLDFQTLLKSKGTIPEEFLFGCGFPTWMNPISDICDPALSDYPKTALFVKLGLEIHHAALG